MGITLPKSRHVLLKSRSDYIAIGYAILLSFACLCRGAVHDAPLALLLLASIPFFVIAVYRAEKTHPLITKAGMGLCLCIALILLLQLFLSFFQDPSSAQPASAGLLHDKGAWFQGIGRVLFLIMAFRISLHIGANAKATRSFLIGLLISGAICVIITFFHKTGGTGRPSFYSHGFVNTNNAASYLAIMLLVSLAHIGHFLTRFRYRTRKLLPEIIDSLDIKTVMKALSLFFAVPLFLAGLFMTASRGGILISLVAVSVFLIGIMIKTSRKSYVQQLLLLTTVIGAATIAIWSFSNFGVALEQRLNVEGFAHHSRLDIFSATLGMIRDHPLIGVGLGGFPAMFQLYRPATMPSEGTVDKAHNSYLEYASELGLPAFLMLMILVTITGYILYQGFRKQEKHYFFSLCGLSVWSLITLHSLIDFPMQIPGIAALVIALLTVCASQTDEQLSSSSATHSTMGKLKRKRHRKRRIRTSPPHAGL